MYLPAADGMVSLSGALYEACLDEQPCQVRRLLSGGADANAVISIQNGTILMAASDNGNVEVVDMLLAAEADANAADNSGKTALIQCGEGSS